MGELLVLKNCIKLAKKNKRVIDVFDLIYETSMFYTSLKDLLDELVAEKELEVIDIKTYKFIGDINRDLDEMEKAVAALEEKKKQDELDKIEAKRVFLEQMRQQRQQLMSKNEKTETAQEHSEDIIEDMTDDAMEEDDDEDERKRTEERRQYLEMRRKELIAKMQAEIDEDDESGEDDDEVMSKDEQTEVNEDKLVEDDKAEKELHLKALQLCCELKAVSVSTFQQAFPIGYIRACKLIDWLEERGYIASGEEGPLRKVFITSDKLIKLINEENYEDINNGMRIDGLNIVSEEKRIVKFLKTIIRAQDKQNKHFEISNETLFESEDSFLQVCGICLLKLVSKNSTLSKEDAIIKAGYLFEEAEKKNNDKATEIYGFIVFHLKNMNIYYYNKLRNRSF